MSGYVLASVLEREMGITPESAKKKRYRGYWIEGVHWIKGPDSRIYYHFPNIQRWAAGNG